MFGTGEFPVKYAVCFFLVLVVPLGVNGCMSYQSVQRLDIGEEIRKTKSVDISGVSRTITFIIGNKNNPPAKGVVKRVAYHRSAGWMLLTLENKTKSASGLEKIKRSLVAEFRKRRVALAAGGPLNIYQRGSVTPTSTDVQGYGNHFSALGVYKYSLAGSLVQYKENTDEFGVVPSVSVVLKVYDLDTGRKILVAAGSRQGWTGATLSTVAERITRDLAFKITKLFQTLPQH